MIPAFLHAVAALPMAVQFVVMLALAVLFGAMLALPFYVVDRLTRKAP